MRVRFFLIKLYIHIHENGNKHVLNIAQIQTPIINSKLIMATMTIIVTVVIDKSD